MEPQYTTIIVIFVIKNLNLLVLELTISKHNVMPVRIVTIERVGDIAKKFYTKNSQTKFNKANYGSFYAIK